MRYAITAVILLLAWHGKAQSSDDIDEQTLEWVKNNFEQNNQDNVNSGTQKTENVDDIVKWVSGLFSDPKNETKHKLNLDPSNVNIQETSLSKPAETSNKFDDEIDNSTPVEQPCTTEDGVSGFCVVYYLCDKYENKGDDTHLRFRRSTGCSSYLDVCCQLEDRNTPGEKEEPKRPELAPKPDEISTDENVDDITKWVREILTTDPNNETKQNAVPKHTSNVNIQETSLRKPAETANKFDDEIDNSTPVEQPCTNEDGVSGFCVAYYLCDQNKTIDVGTHLRFGRIPVCSSYLDVCCQLEERITPGEEEEPKRAALVPNPDEISTDENVDDIAKWVREILTTDPKNETKQNAVPKHLSNVTPGVCYTENQDEGKCVKTSMCAVDPPKIDASTIFTYYGKRSIRSANECSFLQICCPNDKIRKNPVPPTISTPPGCGYSNVGAGKFPELTGTSDSGYADFAEFPWMVALLKNSVQNQASDWDDTDYLGGGTLIHPSVVMTVAHKVDTLAASDLKCRAGEWDTESENESHLHQESEVKKIILHEQFDRLHAHYDVAILIMEIPFLLQPHINVACLSPVMPNPGTLCFSMGWGEDFTRGKYNANVLKKIPLPLIGPHECEERFKKSALGHNFLLHRSLTCAGGVRNVDTCIGDGGSSLVCPVGDPADLRYTVVGMVAYGLECGSEDYPGVYANVPAFYNWVNQQMARQGFRDRLYSI